MICKSHSKNIKILKAKALPSYKMWINQLKNKLETNLYIVLSDENAAIANAFLLGNSKNIENQQKEIFCNASLLHVLAISGMHVSFVIVLASFTLKKADKKRGKIVIIFFLVFFMELTGSTPSVTRAVIMSCFSIISKLVYRKSDTINNITINLKNGGKI